MGLGRAYEFADVWDDLIFGYAAVLSEDLAGLRGDFGVRGEVEIFQVDFGVGL